MLDSIVESSIRNRWLVLIAVAAIAAFGGYNYLRLPIDAVPDITNVQVQINTEAPGFSPLEAEQRITFAVETAMAGLPRLSYTRSVSRYGLSQVTVVFEDGTDIYFARQRVGEKLQEARSHLPPGLEPELGPIATGFGEIFMFVLSVEHGATKPGRRAVRHERPAHRDGLGRAPATRARPRSHRGQHDRRARAAVRGRAPPRLAARVRAHDRGLERRARAQQRERRRRLHREVRQPIPRARARPDRNPRGSARDPRRDTRRRADHGRRPRRGRDRQGPPHRRGHDERRGGRARHRVHADGREQPQSSRGPRPTSSPRSIARCRQACGSTPSTTARRSSTRPSRRCARTWSKARSS